MNKFSLFYLLSVEAIVWFILFFVLKGLNVSNRIEIIVFSVYSVMIIVSFVFAYRYVRSKR